MYASGKTAATLEQVLDAGILPILKQQEAPMPFGEDDDLLLSLHQCPFLNVSVCEASLQHSVKGEAFLVVVYNPLAWPRKAPIQVPMSDAAKTAWAVKGIYIMSLAIFD